MNKKVSDSKQRINELMSYFGLNQTELCRKTGLLKSALSNYLNGDREPRQNQISLIADPFGVNPAWIMGYDVPMFLPEDTYQAKSIREFYKHNPLSDEEWEIIKMYRNVDDSTRKAAYNVLRGGIASSNSSKVV